MITTMAQIISEKELNELVVAIAKRVHPYYREEPKGGCGVYTKPKFIDLDREYYALRVNYDNFGKVYPNEDGTFDIRINCGMGVFHDVKGVDCLEDAIERVIKGYFHA